MYTVMIQSQTAQQWRTTTTSTLSEAVQLTHGLATEWYVVNADDARDYIHSDFISYDLGRKYKHALRSLVARWKSKSYDNVACYRMTDIDLLAYQNSIESRTR